MFPHRICLTNDWLIGAHAASDLVTFLAYQGIALLVFRLREHTDRDVFRQLLLLFTLFISACGWTHLMDVVVLWFPFYWFQAEVKMATAFLSAFTLYRMVKLWLLIRPGEK